MTRFRRHHILWEKGVHDAEIETTRFVLPLRYQPAPRATCYGASLGIGEVDEGTGGEPWIIV